MLMSPEAETSDKYLCLKKIEAFDLKQSIKMLGMLQEASQCMSKFKRKQKQKASGAKKPESSGLTDRRSSDHFGYDDGYKIESQKSKDCYEELREAIKEGLAKQNLLPKSYNEEKCYLDSTKKLDLSVDFSSTSSSPSSVFHSHEFDASDSSFQWSFEEKAKGPLYHQKSAKFTQEKQLGNFKKTPFLDMDMPKPKMDHFCVEKVDSSPQRTLEELIQTEQFHGLVTSPVIDRSNQRKQLSKVYESPPILIIKPKKVSGSVEEDLHKHNFISQDFDIQEILRNLKLKTAVTSRRRNVPKDQATTPDSLECYTLIVLNSSSTENKAKSEDVVSISASKQLDEMRSMNGAIQINPFYDHELEDDLPVIKHTTSEEDVSTGDEVTLTSRNSDYNSKTQTHLSDLSSLINKHKSDSKSRDLLLDNPLFISKAEELFYTNSHTLPSRNNNPPMSPPELLENKSLLQSTGPITQQFPKMFIFLDQLVDEICDGVEDLRKNHWSSGEKFAEDTLPKVLYKDLWCKGVVSGGWDLGWRGGFNGDEVEGIVVHIEHEILNGIIEDMIADNI